MGFSRRDLGLLLAAQQTGAVATMRSKAYANDRISYRGDDRKKGREFFLAATHAGFKIECHETVLGAGLETHPPHKHEHEEIMIVVEGTVEANLDGVKQMVPPGSVVVFGSNRMHNARNAGAVPSRYYIVELRGMEA